MTEEELAQIESLTAKAKRSTDLQKYCDAEWFLLVAIENIPALTAALREAWQERDEWKKGVYLQAKYTKHLTTERDALRAEVATLREALDAIFRVGDGYGPNTEEKPCGTTGEGHAQCRQIARAALSAAEAVRK